MKNAHSYIPASKVELQAFAKTTFDQMKKSKSVLELYNVTEQRLDDLDASLLKDLDFEETRVNALIKTGLETNDIQVAKDVIRRLQPHIETLCGGCRIAVDSLQNLTKDNFETERKIERLQSQITN